MAAPAARLPLASIAITLEQTPAHMTENVPNPGGNPARATRAGVLAALPHFLRPSTLRLLLRDVYYRAPLPAGLRWLLRNSLLQLRSTWAARGRPAGATGPCTQALAVSRRVFSDDPEVEQILIEPGRLSARAFETPVSPQATVIVPVHDHVRHTLACLLSIWHNRPAIAFEIVVVDDASVDATRSLLSSWPGVRYFRNGENLGFVRSCNRGAENARGTILCFLNNDTCVLRGWLDELCRTFREHPEAGIVGSKLLFPTGELQESGGIVWRDGSAWNYGRFAHPDDPAASYLRGVDYASGASLAIRRSLFASLQGFDPHFAPAYYEDSDLAFRVRATGSRVVVQPASLVIHMEGVTSGRDADRGVKRYQAINQRKFEERWRNVLAAHGRNGEEPELEKEREVSRRALVLDALTPFPDRDAGSVTADYYLRILQALGYKVTFAPEELRYRDEYTLRLQRRGVECLYYPFEQDLPRFLRRRGREFDLVFVSRPYVAGRVLDRLRIDCPRAKWIYNAVDLHHLRELRQAELERNPALALRAERTRAQELAIISAADCTIVLSEAERALLQQAVPQARVEVIPLIHEEELPGRAFRERHGLIFIGGAQHPPNLDAVRHFVASVMPALRAAGVDHDLGVIGVQPPEVHALAGSDVTVHGHVPDLAPLFHAARCMVVPVRYGAGVKGKIGTAFSYGLPVVSTRVGVEGMDLVAGRDYLPADSPEEWVAQLGRLGQDEALWNLLSEAGRRIVRERYSPACITERLKAIIASL